MKTLSLKQLIEELGDDDKYRAVFQSIADHLAEQDLQLRENAKDIRRLENRSAAIERKFSPRRTH